jgi:hypothetical protein
LDKAVAVARQETASSVVSIPVSVGVHVVGK